MPSKADFVFHKLGPASDYDIRVTVSDDFPVVQHDSVDLHVRMLAPSYSQYQRAAQRWWSGVEPTYIRGTEPRRL